MKTETLKYIVQAFNCASDDGTRYTIQGVLVYADAGAIHVVATDGHILSETKVSDVELEPIMGSDRYVVTPDLLPLLKQLAKDFKTPGGMDCEKTADGILLKGFGFTVTIKTEKALGWEYPDYKQVIPKNNDSFVVGFNPEYLWNLFESMKHDKRASGVVLRFSSDPIKPIIVEVDGNPDARGVLMPRRVK